MRTGLLPIGGDACSASGLRGEASAYRGTVTLKGFTPRAGFARSPRRRRRWRHAPVKRFSAPACAGMIKEGMEDFAPACPPRMPDCTGQPGSFGGRASDVPFLGRSDWKRIGNVQARVLASVGAMLVLLREAGADTAIYLSIGPGCTRDSLAADAGPSATLLRARFGLTPAEDALARRLAAGQTVSDIARANGVSRHTVRTQLKAVLSKTDTHRQCELVRLVCLLATEP